MAAFHVMEAFGKDAQLLILRADHLIDDEEEFAAAVQTARQIATNGTLVTFGITPTRPETGYGYIECGSPAGFDGSHHVARFVEKPTLEVAGEFVASGRFLWNSGMFCFSAQAFVNALEQCAPALYAASQACWSATEKSNGDKIQLAEERSRKSTIFRSTMR